MRDIMRKEIGVFSLTRQGNTYSSNELTTWFTGAVDCDYVLDFLQLSLQTIDLYSKNTQYSESRKKAIRGIAEINARLQEAAVGYEYKNNILVEIGSEFIHGEVVLPALEILSGSHFRGANEEFRAAHEDYRMGDYEGAIVECGKAFESVLKSICDRRGWDRDPKATAKVLLDVVFERGLIPEYISGNFKQLRSLLEGGVPTLRNKQGGHGAGASARVVPKHIASFQLHQTASAILLLHEADIACN